MILIILRELEITTKVFKGFANLNSRNQVIAHYQFGQILNRGSRGFLYSESGTLVYSDNHACPTAPSRKLIQPNLILVSRAVMTAASSAN